MIATGSVIQLDADFACLLTSACAAFSFSEIESKNHEGQNYERQTGNSRNNGRARGDANRMQWVLCVRLPEWVLLSVW